MRVQRSSVVRRARGGALVLATMFTATALAVLVSMSIASASSDSFAGATEISAFPFTDSANNVAATSEFGEPEAGCAVNAAAVSDSVWWRFTADTDLQVTIDTIGSSIDTVLVAYRQSVANIAALSEEACDDDSGGNLTSMLTFAAEEGRTYAIRVQTYSGSPNGGEIVLNASAVPANDDFANWSSLFTGTPEQGTNVNATLEANEPTGSCATNGSATGSSVWWRLSPSSPTPVHLTTAGSDFDTVLTVYTGTSLEDLVEVACDDNSFGGLQSFVSLDNSPPGSFYVQVTGFSGATGSISLNASLGACAPTFYVDHTATGANTGASWENAFNDLQDALNAARTCPAGASRTTEIHIADGTYTPTSPGADRTASFDMVNGVELVAPFPSGGGATPDPSVALVTLSGDLNGDDTTGGSTAENSYRVVTSSVPGAGLSGLTITGGTRGPVPFDAGSAVHSGVGSSVTLDDVVVEENGPYALFHEGFTLTVRDSIVRNNGNQAIFTFGSAKILNSEVSGHGQLGINAQPVAGKTVDVINSRIIDTTGGGILIAGAGDTRLINSVISGNTDDGVELLSDGEVEIINTAIVDNGGFGLGDDPFGNGILAVDNSIIWSNTLGSLDNQFGLVVTVTSSIVEGSGGSAAWVLPATDGGGNLDINPSFVDAPNGNYRLNPGSPAVDVGANGVMPNDINDLDLDGNFFEPIPDLDLTDRIEGGLIDLGPYELATAPCAAEVFVDADNAGPFDGTSWALAFPDLTLAIARAESCAPTTTQIWIADGTYTPHATDPTVSFELPHEIELVGGFNGTELFEAERNLFVTPPAVLSGDLAGDDDTGGSNAENSERVVNLQNGRVGRIRDLTITAGNADGGTVSGAGVGFLDAELFGFGITFSDNHSDSSGGALMFSGNAWFEDSTFDGNTSGQFGGAVRAFGTFTGLRSQFTNNEADVDGGAIMVEPNGSARLGSVVVDGNKALAGEGGGILNTNTLVVASSRISNNESTSFGGGIHNIGSLSYMVLTNSLVVDNEASSAGGGVFIKNSATIVGSTIANNTSLTQSGGGILVDGGAGPVNIDNSIVWGNDAPTNPQLNIVGTGSVRSSDIEGSGGSGAGWPAQMGTDGGGNIDADPDFLSPGLGNYAPTAAGIDVGDSSLVALDELDIDSDGSTTDVGPDFSGAQRIQGSQVDMGAFEQFVEEADGLTVLGAPCVVYDTDGAGELPFVGGETRTVQVTGALSGQGGASSCVPAGASSVVFTISSIDPLTEGNLLLTPAGVAATGSAGVVNYGAVNGLNNANTVTVPVSAAGAVDVGANAGPAGAVPTTDVRLVAVGYYSPDVDADLKFFPVNPCAVADSRTNQGASDSFDGPNGDGLWPVGSAFPDIDVVGVFPGGQGGGNTDCGVPAGADAVMVNVVAVNMEGGSGQLSVGVGGSDPVDEATTPFAVLSPKMNNGATTIVNVGAGGTIAVDIDGDALASTMIRVEILGYYDQDTAGLDFTDVTPCAVFDTRTNQGAAGSFAGERQHGPANTTTYQIAGDSVPVGQGGVVDTGGSVGTCGVPDDAKAVLINLEAVNALREGNFWVSAAGTTTTGGVLNFNNVTPKMNNANAVVVPLDGSGQLDLEINAGNFTPVGTDVAHARGVILGYYN